MNEFVPYKLNWFKRLRAEARIIFWEKSPNTHRRNVAGQLQIFLENNQDQLVWMPVNYCISRQFTNEEINTMKAKI